MEKILVYFAIKYEGDWEKIYSAINKKERVDIDVVNNTIKEHGEKYITMLSDQYPSRLKSIYKPPFVLFYRGNINLINGGKTIAIIGSRENSEYGETITKELSENLSNNGVTIVSGLAKGIDSIAHEACLHVKGNTIAVLGNGLNEIYPLENKELQKRIEENGLVLSEYPNYVKANKENFPIRNRIIAGLSKAIFIVEATEKSGSMHTKNYALDYNRDVFALPARINDIYSVGCNKCIQNGQAQMILSANEIIELFGKTNNNVSKEVAVQLSYEEQMIYDLLVGHEKHFDEILKSTGFETKTLQTLLMRMVLKGVIDKQPNNFYGVK
jgi:DNA processing protein